MLEASNNGKLKILDIEMKAVLLESYPPENTCGVVVSGIPPKTEQPYVVWRFSQRQIGGGPIEDIYWRCDGACILTYQRPTDAKGVL